MTIDNRRRGEGLERDTQRGAVGFPDWAELRLPQDKEGVGFFGRISLRQEESVCPGKRMGRAVVEAEGLHAACLGGARTGDVWDHVWRIQREQRPAAGSRGSCGLDAHALGVPSRCRVSAAVPQAPWAFRAAGSATCREDLGEDQVCLLVKEHPGTLCEEQ